MSCLENCCPFIILVYFSLFLVLGVLQVKEIDDAKDWKHFLVGLDSMGFTAAEKFNTLAVLSAILMLGNIHFSQSGGAQVDNEKVLQNVADLVIHQ